MNLSMPVPAFMSVLPDLELAALPLRLAVEDSLMTIVRLSPTARALRSPNMLVWSLHSDAASVCDCSGTSSTKARIIDRIVAFM